MKVSTHAKVAPSSLQGADVGNSSDIVAEVLAAWPTDVVLDAQSLISQRPELREHRSVVLDLAYEEYCQRQEFGEAMEPRGFSRRFPTVWRSLLRLLEVDQFVQKHPQFFQANSEICWPTCGDIFQNFHLVEDLGRGAFSRVFLAREPDLGNRSVVVKIAPHGGLEPHALGKLAHPNIVPVFSVRTDEQTGLSAICMPFLSRKTLFDVLEFAFLDQKAPCSAQVIREAVQDVGACENRTLKDNSSALFGASYANGIAQIGLQLSQALAFTHSAGFFHCDVKPSNVLITADGRAMLFDFNLSFQKQDERTQIGGTLPYMAPEQLRALCSQSEEITEPLDCRTDIFSLGVTLFELLTGELPFETVSSRLSRSVVAKKLLVHQRRGPRRLQDLNSNVDADLARLVERCLAFSPDARPQTANDLVVALERLLATKRGWLSRVPGRMRNVRFMAAAAAVAGILGVAGYRVSVEKSGSAPLVVSDIGTASPELPRQHDQSRRDGTVQGDPTDRPLSPGHELLQQLGLMKTYQSLVRARESSRDGTAEASLGYWLARTAAEHQGSPGIASLFDEAIGHYKFAIKQHRTSFEVYNNFAFCLRQIGDDDRVRANLEQADRMRSEQINHVVESAAEELASAQADQTTANVSVIVTALRRFPESEELHFQAALFYAQAAHVCDSKSSPQVLDFENRAFESAKTAIQLGLAYRKRLRIARLNVRLHERIRGIEAREAQDEAPAGDSLRLVDQFQAGFPTTRTETAAANR